VDLPSTFSRLSNPSLVKEYYTVTNLECDNQLNTLVSNYQAHRLLLQAECVRHYPQGVSDMPTFEGEVPDEVREVWESLGGRWKGYEESKVEETQKYLQEREWTRV
jgi:hypothetical protein